MYISKAIVGVLVVQFRKAVHPFRLTDDVQVIQMGNARVLMWANATYSWGIHALCMTTTPWTAQGTKTPNLYYEHPDVNCWPTVLKTPPGQPI